MPQERRRSKNVTGKKKCPHLHPPALPPAGLLDPRGATGCLSPEQGLTTVCPISHSWCQHPGRLLLLLRLQADPAQIRGRLLCDQQPVLQARSHVRARLPDRPGEGAWGSDAPPWSSGHQGGPCCVFSPGLGPAEGPGGLPLGRGRRGEERQQEAVLSLICQTTMLAF